jgi:hypothetical protein
MIWFACKQCGKRLKQSESAAGSLVFCDCGQANRVPWESTIAAPEEPPPEREAPADDTQERERPRRRRRRETPPPRDPAYCFNHEDAASEQTCADCGEHFCAACVVDVRGKTLCGPCKNYRIARMQRSPRVSGMAIASLIMALVGGPLGFCIAIMGIWPSQQSPAWAIVLGAAEMIVPAVALVLGLLSLREIENNPGIGGRALAIIGSATAVIGVVWAVTMMLVQAGKPLVE